MFQKKKKCPWCGKFGSEQEKRRRPSLLLRTGKSAVPIEPHWWLSHTTIFFFFKQNSFFFLKENVSSTSEAETGGQPFEENIARGDFYLHVLGNECLANGYVSQSDGIVNFTSSILPCCSALALLFFRFLYNFFNISSFFFFKKNVFIKVDEYWRSMTRVLHVDRFIHLLFVRFNEQKTQRDLPGDVFISSGWWIFVG